MSHWTHGQAASVAGNVRCRPSHNCERFCGLLHPADRHHHTGLSPANAAACGVLCAAGHHRPGALSFLPSARWAAVGREARATRQRRRCCCRTGFRPPGEPMVLGHRVALNPVAVFIGLAFWLWIWGVPGAFIAVPVLATLKICCDHIAMLAPGGSFWANRRNRISETVSTESCRRPTGRRIGRSPAPPCRRGKK